MKKIYDFFRLKCTNTLDFFIQSDKGATAIIVGLLLVVLIGFSALAIDVGLWYSQKRKLQLTADTAAVSGAIALVTNGKDKVNLYVQKDLELNNCSAANNCSLLELNNPPKNGSYVGNTNAVEVILEQPGDISLAGLFMDSLNMKARAVAVNAPASDCILLLGNSLFSLLTSPLTLASSAHVKANLCNVYINALGIAAISASGGASLDVNKLTIGQGSLLGLTTGLTSTLGITVSAPAAKDPYANFVIPSFSPGSQIINTNGIITLNPGSYSSIIAQAGSQVFLNPGVYFIDSGNFIVRSGATLVGKGVTIISTSSKGIYGTTTIESMSNVTLTALESGPTAGFLFIGDRASANLTANLNGGASQNLSGILYFPTQTLNLTGGTSFAANLCLEVVAKVAKLTGSISFGSCTKGAGKPKLVE